MCGCGALRTAHHTCGFGFAWFFGLGCFSLAVYVWEVGLVHTVMLDAMLGSVSVVWEYVGYVVFTNMAVLPFEVVCHVEVSWLWAPWC